MTDHIANRQQDLDLLHKLSKVTAPGRLEKTQLCCFFSRYSQDELGPMPADIAYDWGYSPRTLQAECLEIWLSGYRPTNTDYRIGSANDTTED